MEILPGTLDGRLREMMTRLQTSVEGIVVAAVISNDGLGLSSTLNQRQHEEKLAAMSASMHLLGDRISNELMASRSSQVIILAEKGSILLVAAGQEATLLCIAHRNASLGLVLHQMKRYGHEVGELLDGGW